MASTSGPLAPRVNAGGGDGTVVVGAAVVVGASVVVVASEVVVEDDVGDVPVAAACCPPGLEQAPATRANSAAHATKERGSEAGTPHQYGRRCQVQRIIPRSGAGCGDQKAT
jgi:hypothetical protein